MAQCCCDGRPNSLRWTDPALCRWAPQQAQGTSPLPFMFVIFSQFGSYTVKLARIRISRNAKLVEFSSSGSAAINSFSNVSSASSLIIAANISFRMRAAEASTTCARLKSRISQSATSASTARRLIGCSADPKQIAPYNSTTAIRLPCSVKAEKCVGVLRRFERTKSARCSRLMTDYWFVSEAKTLAKAT